MELDERKKKILQAVIRNYLETGEPVGSRTISKYTDLNLSSATIRNEMADLEEMGYILQPHTSAGRIPSDMGYRLYVDEWNYRLSEVILSKSSDSRKRYLLDISNKIRIDIRQFGAIITLLESSKRDFTTDDILSRFLNVNSESYLFPFMESMIEHHKALGKIRTAETYAATLRSFRRFRDNEDLALDDINSDTMIAYEVYLKVCGVSHNSSSFYMRNLRAVYNRAVEKELTLQRYPFKNVYTGVDKTTKRALPIKEIKHIKNVDLSEFCA